MVRWSHIDCLIMRTSFFKCTPPPPPPLWLRAPGKPINDPVKVYQKHVNYKVISFYVTFEFFSIKISNQLMIAKHVMFLNQELWGHRCNHKINSHNYKIHSITGGQEWHVLSESIALYFFISMLWLPRYSYQHFQMAKSLLENVFVIGLRMKRGGIVNTDIWILCRLTAQ